ncbi:hypothetical protein [Campylobacter sputorum]|uniref:hypothetical protein n=1 Tax=Campylobacter sputorum TaxID=206 RepID=UPI00053BEFE5|nr:hypothetical protein [Campylobacter sputorum]
MKLKETSGKYPKNSFLKENYPEPLYISFTRIIKDLDFGLPSSHHSNINDKDKIQKIVKTLMFIREQKPHELIQTPKQQQIGGCEKCEICKWQWREQKVKNHLLKNAQSQVFIIRAGDSRIFGSILNNCFYIHAIEYTLGDVYKH